MTSCHCWVPNGVGADKQEFLQLSLRTPILINGNYPLHRDWVSGDILHLGRTVCILVNEAVSTRIQIIMVPDKRQH